MYHIPQVKLLMVKDGAVKSEVKAIHGSQDVFNLMSGYFAGHDREEFAVLLLDTKHKVNGVHTVSIGSVNMSIVHPRETFKAAIVCNASAVILVHNHPSGDPTPSQEDRTLTARLKECGTLLGIPVIDHVVIGDGRYESFADQGWL